MMFMNSELAYFRYRFSFPEEYHFITNQDAAIDLLDLSLREAAELKSRVSRCTHTIDLTLNDKQSVYSLYHQDQAAYLKDVMRSISQTRADKKLMFTEVFFVLETQGNGNLHVHCNVAFTDNAFHEARLKNLRKWLIKTYGFNLKGVYLEPIKNQLDRRNYLFKCRSKHPKYIYEYRVTPSDDGVSRAE